MSHLGLPTWIVLAYVVVVLYVGPVLALLSAGAVALCLRDEARETARS